MANNFVCFKYRSIDKNTIASLVDSSVYLASRNALNDPFDSNIEIRKVLKRLIRDHPDKETEERYKRILSDRVFFEAYDSAFDQFGIFSVSINQLNTLMWSHYADEHRGLVLTYSFSPDFLDNPDEILGVTPVRYQDDAISEWLREHVPLFEDDHMKFVGLLMRRILSSKAPAWRHEEEGRIIHRRQGIWEIPRNKLKQVTFGLRTSNRDESLVRALIEKYYGSVVFARIVRSDEDFGLELIQEGN